MSSSKSVKSSSSPCTEGKLPMATTQGKTKLLEAAKRSKYSSLISDHVTDFTDTPTHVLSTCHHGRGRKAFKRTEKKEVRGIYLTNILINLFHDLIQVLATTTKKRK